MEPKKEIYNEVWFFYKNYLRCSGSHNAWAQLTQEAPHTVDKHNGDMFARELIYAVINEIGRVIK